MKSKLATAKSDQDSEVCFRYLHMQITLVYFIRHTHYTETDVPKKKQVVPSTGHMTDIHNPRSLQTNEMVQKL